ncbi:ead/Ea22-like family protein [Orrella dioscoreae]|uniref:Uncharacterized protein n=1 Tax=Orrella dioscoreae TaxID=1851544 RepID=A0A1C3K1D1_9BURK|nr:ead/Ea22-like family protein [Orrella dioscoreae]SBT25306.1 hypothetical protein ODI_03609 [Orrella dioscoreae]SOE49082.1 hypothetical protein ODI_R1832 [Orrella dioscoreae]
MTVDTAKLRELIAKATPGPWVAKDSRGAGLEIYADVGTQMRGEKREWPFFSTGNADVKQGLIAYEQWVQFPTEKLNNIQAWNAAYIAASNPVTLTALLDALERKDAEVARLREALEEIASPEWPAGTRVIELMEIARAALSTQTEQREA